MPFYTQGFIIAADGYQMAVDEQYDLAALDLNLPKIDRFTVLEKLYQEKPTSKGITLSAVTIKKLTKIPLYPEVF